MKIVTLAELHAYPAGTVYCETEEGMHKYAEDLYAKGESSPPGECWFGKTECLPQPTSGRKIPWFQPETTRHFDSDPGNYNNAGDPVYVFEEADLDRLAVLIGRGPGWVAQEGGETEP
jgi:hypothetical protein